MQTICKHGVRWCRTHAWWLAGVGVVVAAVVALPPLWAAVAARGEIFGVHTAPQRKVAIVFGAGVYPDGTPTPFLASRLRAAVDLYMAGKARVLLLSGDNRTTHYNEPAAMARYVEAHGVPASAVVLDYAGYDTYATCYRAHAVFGVTSATLVTHGYHLPRALLTCRSLGISSVGVAADQAGVRFSKLYLAREVLALDKAAAELSFKPKPAVLGSQEHGVQQALARSN
ncbi:MAG TPA: ElyC/SanA/YdcF family protein [Candidatus Saccharimonadales bacterium]|nr:ElyC/SanA/YdcF family protein [Candidatus Saccharimonadales bacterium]